MTSFYLVRHGETDLNNDTYVSQDKIRGWSNPPLNEKGRQHAQKLGEKLKGAGIQVIISSDLGRAKETAEIIGKIIGVKPIFTQKLRPWDLGNLTGTSTKEAIPKIAAYIKTPFTAIPKGESFHSFKQRAFAGLADAFDIAAGRRLCIVSHHRMERLIKSYIAAGQPETHDKVDLNVFKEKGEAPGHVEVITLDEAKVRKVRNESPRGTITRSIASVKATTP